MKKIEIPKEAVLLSVLFAPVNVAGQTPAGQDSPFTGAVFEHYYKRLSCHLESKSELHSTIISLTLPP